VSAFRDAIGPLVFSLFLGCSASKDVVLGDLPSLDAALEPEDSAPDGSSKSDSAFLDATFPEAGSDGPPTSCTSGQAVPAAAREFLTQAIGFGRLASGGSDGCVYHVTTLAEAGSGSLREGAERAEPLWIVFDVSGDIALTSPIVMGSNKTVDGRGAAITVRNFGFILGAPTSNVVIEHLTFVGNMQGSNNDAIQIADGAHTVWIDHCSLSNYGDGLVDITHAATDITVSWSVFSMHDAVMLIGRAPMDVEDVNIRVTVHHNWWNQTGTYAPRLRFGKAHVLNNLIDQWRSAASASTMDGEIYSEGNVFVAKDDKVAVGTSAGSDMVLGRAISIRDWLQNGAIVQTNLPDLVFQPRDFYLYTPDRADATLQAAIMADAGAH
jgi:pectate lyase